MIILTIYDWVWWCFISWNKATSFCICVLPVEVCCCLCRVIFLWLAHLFLVTSSALEDQSLFEKVKKRLKQENTQLNTNPFFQQMVYMKVCHTIFHLVGYMSHCIALHCIILCNMLVAGAFYCFPGTSTLIDTTFTGKDDSM